MSFAVQSGFKQSFYYGSYGSKENWSEDPVGKEFTGSATSRTTSSDKGKNIGVMTIGTIGYIAKYADSSTEAEPVIKIGDYEARVNDVDPKNATEIEMFALTSYMDDKGLTDKTGMKSFSKMRAYSMQAEYNGFCSGISDEGEAWTENRDWTAILANAKESYYKMPQSYQHGLDCEKLISDLSEWSQGLQDNKSIADYSEKEWDKLLEGVDEKIEEMKEAVSEDIDKTEKIKETDDKRTSEQNTDLLTARYTTFEQGSTMTDPKTGQLITVKYTYRNYYTKEGIISGKYSYDSREAGIKDTYNWKVDFNSEEDYERAMRFLDRIPEGDTTKFLTREDFWQDFVNGDIDEEEFFEYYETLDHGKANFLKQDENGNAYVDKEMMSGKFYKYFGIEQLRSVPWDDLQMGLELSALKERGFDHNDVNKKEEISLYASLREAFGSSGSDGFRFEGEEKTYSLDEWVSEIIKRAHLGLYDSLYPGEYLKTSDKKEDAVTIPDTIASRHTEYTDPKTGGKVPVDIKYVTSYSDKGITCREEQKDGDKESSRELWTIDFRKEGDLSKVKELLDSFNDEDRLTFASNEGFWRDYLNGSIDVEGFKEYYASTDNGVIDYEGEMQSGRKLRDILGDEYAEYVNNQHFIGKVFTEQEMWDNWYARIEASQKAARRNGLGMEPPTSTIETSNNRARTYRDQAFRYIGSRAPESVEKAWLDAADEIGIDGQGLTDMVTLDHIPQFMIQRFIRQYNGLDADDVLGSTIGSAIISAQNALYSLDHPLEPDTKRTAEVIKAREKERAFYERFIEKLRKL